MKLDILGITYEIKDYPFADNEQAMGRWLEAKSEILIKEDMTPQQKELTIWHEIVHIVLKAIGEDALCSNEDFVEKLSRAMYQIARPNYYVGKCCLDKYESGETIKESK